MITVCVGVKNREKNLIHCLIESLNRCENNGDIFLSVFDCGTPGIKEAIRAKWPHRLIFNKEEMDFARTYSLNKAAEAAKTEYLFFSDVDMVLPKNFISQFYQNVSPRKVWFPVCFSLNKNTPPIISTGNGYWRETGYGMCGFYKKDFIKIGGWNQRYMIYGAEDNDIYGRCIKEKFEIIRENCIGLFHTWHPINKFGRENEV